MRAVALGIRRACTRFSDHAMARYVGSAARPIERTAPEATAAWTYYR
jgi:hypothetical protein